MALKAQGRDIANMGAGEPDFEMRDRVRLAAVDAMKSGQTRYTPMAGTRALRGAIAATLLRENGMNHSPGEILVSNGAKQAIYNAVRALVDPGDEVIFLNSPNNPSGAMYSRHSAKCRATIRTSGSSAMTSTSICWWVPLSKNQVPRSNELKIDSLLGFEGVYASTPKAFSLHSFLLE